MANLTPYMYVIFVITLLSAIRLLGQRKVNTPRGAMANAREMTGAGRAIVCFHDVRLGFDDDLREVVVGIRETKETRPLFFHFYPDHENIETVKYLNEEDEVMLLSVASPTGNARRAESYIRIRKA